MYWEEHTLLISCFWDPVVLVVHCLSGLSIKCIRKTITQNTPQTLFLRNVWSVIVIQKNNVNKALYSLVAILANPRSFIIFSTIIISTIIEWPVSFSNRSSSSLIIKMPMKTCKRPMLCTFMLQEWWTLFDSELLQISAKHHINYSERSNETVASN